MIDYGGWNVGNGVGLLTLVAVNTENRKCQRQFQGLESVRRQDPWHRHWQAPAALYLLAGPRASYSTISGHGSTDTVLFINTRENHQQKNKWCHPGG